MAWWVATLSAAVKLVSLPRALHLVSGSAPRYSSQPDNHEDLATAIDALLSLNVFFLKPICWKRAAILHRYLGHRGVVTTINFGVRKGSAGPLTGHAWLEADGRPIFETEKPEYAVTYVYPSVAPFVMELTSFASLAKQKPVDGEGN
jgi:hypothetical protein